MRLGFVGLSHLGLNSLAAAAAKGFSVLGFDRDVRNIAAGTLPYVEPDLPELLQRHAEQISWTSDSRDLGACDLVYLSQDVPTDSEGHSDLSLLQNLLQDILPVLHPQAILVILCQVPPGFTRQVGLPHARLYYQVETLIFGQAIHRALYPEHLTVGCADPNQPLASSLQTYLESFACPILKMDYESAELAKIAINCCLVASISTTNTLSALCERMGASWQAIRQTLHLDRRIGPYAYLQPGLGIAGGNLERDLRTVCSLAAEHGSEALGVQAWLQQSAWQKDWVLRTLYEQVLRQGVKPRIGLLGLSYKPGTNSLKNAPSLRLLPILQGFALQIFDPLVSLPDLPCVGSLAAAYSGVDVLIILTACVEFKSLTAKDLAGTMRGRVIIDPFGVLREANLQTAGFCYSTLGEPFTVQKEPIC